MLLQATLYKCLMAKYFSTDKTMIGLNKKLRPTDPNYFAYVTGNINIFFRPNMFLRHTVKIQKAII